jgi:hypothetical protein
MKQSMGRGGLILLQSTNVYDPVTNAWTQILGVAKVSPHGNRSNRLFSFSEHIVNISSLIIKGGISGSISDQMVMNLPKLLKTHFQN